MLGGQEGGPYSSPPLPGGEGVEWLSMDQIGTRPSPSEEGWKLILSNTDRTVLNVTAFLSALTVPEYINNANSHSVKSVY